MFLRKLATAARLTGPEWRWTMRALPWLLAVRVCLPAFGVKRTREFMRPPLRTTGTVGAHAWRAIVRGVDIAARNQPGQATCLPRALVLHRFLSSVGCPSELHLGVRRAGDALDGHAWVTIAGEPVGEPPAVSESFVRIRGALQ